MAILHGSWLFQPQVSSLGTSESGESSAQSAGGQFLIWGETWRRVETNRLGEGDTARNILRHPFALSRAELLDLLRSLDQSHRLAWPVADVPLVEPVPSAKGRGRKRTATLEPSPAILKVRWQTLRLFLPTYVNEIEGETSRLPQYSVALPDGETDGTERSPSLELHPWQIEGLLLSPLEAFQLLNSLPLSTVGDADSFISGDLRFWSHAARWSLDLLARAKFLPGLRLQDGAAIATWQVLLDSEVDQTRLQQFSRRMPPACRTYQLPHSAPDDADDADDAESPFPAARLVLLDFLNRVTEAQIRQAIAAQPLPAAPLPKDIALREWLQALGDEEGAIAAEPARIERLQSALTQWTAPIAPVLNQQIAAFRTCFYLHPPAAGQTDWTLEYFLQATDDPEFLLSARTIWSNPVDRLVYLERTIPHPQETLLAGLGLASRLYPVLEPSLQTSQPQSCRLNPLQVYEFIRSTAWRLQDSGFGVVLPPSLSQEQGWANRLGLSVRAEAPKGSAGMGLKSLLNFKWELTIGGQRISKAEFDRLVALNTPLVEINGEWVELRPQDIRAAQDFFASRKDQMALSLEDALRISTGDTQTIEKLPVVSFEASGALQDLISTLTTGNQNLSLIPTPKGFQGELRPYQLRGASWLAFLEQWGLGACLADDMGLGKTIQLIALLLHLQETEQLEKPVLLVCPTSVLGNWEREVKRFGPSLRVWVQHGDKRPQGAEFARTAQRYHLVITSYALVYRDEKDLKRVSWQGVVLDEAQNIKNPEAKQSQAVRQLDAQFRIALTGTPVENRLSELWSILDFLNPGYLGPRNFFQRRFSVPIERYGDTDSLKILRSLVQPFILRRLKTDRDIIQDLPEKQEMTVFCGLTAEQAAIYQRLVDRSLEQIESADGIQRHGMILALLTRLKQVCNHPVLLQIEEDEEDGKVPPELESPTALLAGSGKLQRLTEMLEELLAEGDRTLIFTQFAKWGKQLQAYLEQQFKREVIFLYGGSSKKQREEMVDRFQNDPQGPRIFILSLKAGGVGLNLTRANHVFHYDRWWNPAVENQATDRAFRIGQTRNVQVHKFVCTGTLEERIHDLIESKKALSEQVVGTGENWLTELDTDQLRQLLLLDRSAIIDE
ncbi:DEAD/DEAH box helicase family protein [Thermoleptolyngbya oregonensis NK1-22]|uniref:DEAD/DEAH box helicase family protein n=1 Tax=Thermoleptolyngbya oregonensis NK1-22 TaxID=2547457 RepID=A0AA96YD17_9CYAN|nr:DEAD/DEAH box helicase family protein [Thermoleptolyngbya oregonensis NK1-22]